MAGRSRFHARVSTLLIGSALGANAFMGCGGVSEDPIARWRKSGTGGRGEAGTAGGGLANGGGAGSHAGGSLSEGGSAPNSGGAHAPEGGTASTPDGGGGGGNAGALSSEGGRATMGGEGGVPAGGQAGAGGVPAGGQAGAGGVSEGGQAGAGKGGGAGEPTRCSPTAPFGTLARVPGLPEGAIRLRLNSDETVAYYSRFLGLGEYDIARAVRATRHDSFSNISYVATNDAGWDLSPSVTGDESMLYFESQRSTGGAWRIHQSVRHSEFDAFVSADLVPGLRDATAPGTGSDGAPYITPSGDTLYFHSGRFKTGQGLARAVRVGTSFARVEQLVVTFASGSPRTLGCPVVTPDELTLYFSAIEDGKRADIWRATRAKMSDSFGVATLVSELDTEEFNEAPSFISEDGCRLYFDRNTNGPGGWSPDYGIGYVAEREPDSD